jgi:hypothetical protein
MIPAILWGLGGKRKRNGAAVVSKRAARSELTARLFAGVERVCRQFARRFHRRHSTHGEAFRTWLLTTLIPRMQELAGGFSS